MAETPLISECCARDPFASQSKKRKAEGGGGNGYFQKNHWSHFHLTSVNDIFPELLARAEPPQRANLVQIRHQSPWKLMKSKGLQDQAFCTQLEVSVQMASGSKMEMESRHLTEQL